MNSGHMEFDGGFKALLKLDLINYITRLNVNYMHKYANEEIICK